MSALVGIVMGSDSDMPVMEKAGGVLDHFGVGFEIEVMSAHRKPARVSEYASTAEERGLKVIIAGAGLAAHLPGVVAAHTPLPVIGVPLYQEGLAGADAFVRMLELHGVRPDRVIVTGAPRFDEFFEMRPSTSREEFCTSLGLDATRPLILYTCSSNFVAPREVEFVRRWICELRRAADPRLRECGVVARLTKASENEIAASKTPGPVSVWSPSSGTPKARSWSMSAAK